MRLYLAGPINGTTDTEAHAWRETVEAALTVSARGIECVNPMRRDYRGREDANVVEIVEGDKTDIDSCDRVLAFCWRASWGTPMEIQYAHSKGIPVLAVVAGDIQHVSPWLRYHATIYRTLGDAVVAIAREVKDSPRATGPGAGGER